MQLDPTHSDDDVCADILESYILICSYFCPHPNACELFTSQMMAYLPSVLCSKLWALETSARCPSERMPLPPTVCARECGCVWRGCGGSAVNLPYGLCFSVLLLVWFPDSGLRRVEG